MALYDYKGRTEKELSFKKGTQLAIRGQLSTDWWQGSVLATSGSTPLKIGYIPDKYIAFRSSSKKLACLVKREIFRNFPTKIVI